MKRIGNNEFFETERGAKCAGTRRNVPEGSTITQTSEGFCLLEPCEGADDKSWSTIRAGRIVSKRYGDTWRKAWAMQE